VVQLGAWLRIRTQGGGHVKQRKRYAKAEGLGGFQVDDQLDLGGLLNPKADIAECECSLYATSRHRIRAALTWHDLRLNYFDFGIRFKGLPDPIAQQSECLLVRLAKKAPYDEIDRRATRERELFEVETRDWLGI
jgi:hypothetical protein